MPKLERGLKDPGEEEAVVPSEKHGTQVSLSMSGGKQQVCVLFVACTSACFVVCFIYCEDEVTPFYYLYKGLVRDLSVMLLEARGSQRAGLQPVLCQECF